MDIATRLEAAGLDLLADPSTPHYIRERVIARLSRSSSTDQDTDIGTSEDRGVPIGSLLANEPTRPADPAHSVFAEHNAGGVAAHASETTGLSAGTPARQAAGRQRCERCPRSRPKRQRLFPHGDVVLSGPWRTVARTSYCLLHTDGVAPELGRRGGFAGRGSKAWRDRTIAADVNEHHAIPLSSLLSAGEGARPADSAHRRFDEHDAGPDGVHNDFGDALPRDPVGRSDSGVSEELLPRLSFRVRRTCM
jgi:hypothetical protein